MGGSLSKHKDAIDGGATKKREENAEYDQSTVRRYICERRLMPFYEGKPDPTPDNQSADSLQSDEDRLLIDFRDSEGRSNATTATAADAERRRHRWPWKKKKAKSPQVLLAFLGEARTECPICFLNFPRNINRTGCCNQAVCTACFVSIRRPPSGRVISCPFCNRRDFSVVYKSPYVLLGLAPARHQPVRCEAIRAYRPPTVAPSAAYRSATVRTGYSPTQRYRHYNGAPFSVGTAARATTYGGGVLVLYNERGEQYAYPARRPAYGYPGNAQIYSSAPYRSESYRYSNRHVLSML